MKITREKLEQIFEETESNWEGDNAFKGLQILYQYTDNLIQGAEHDIIYSISIDEIIELGITDDHCYQLRLLNWMVDSDCDCLACFV